MSKNCSIEITEPINKKNISYPMTALHNYLCNWDLQIYNSDIQIVDATRSKIITSSYSILIKIKVLKIALK